MKKAFNIIVLSIICLSCIKVVLASEEPELNPHKTGSHCLECHDLPPEKGNATFLFDGDIVKVCNRCHEDDDIHPVNIKVRDCMKGDIPDYFPLEDGDTITCLTCHDFRFHEKEETVPPRDFNEKFLRGWPWGDAFENLNFMCYECHKKYGPCGGGGGMNPHMHFDQEGDIIEEKCLFCHTKVPDVNVAGIREGMFKGDVSSYCYGCHAGKEKDHPAKFTHEGIIPTKEQIEWIEVSERMLGGVKLVLLDGKIFCGTCHNPHQDGVLKGSANAGADKPNQLRLPADELCVACHNEEKKR